MSATSNVTVLGFRRWAVSRPDRGVVADRPAVRVATFAALALWGTSRWATLIKPAPEARLYGICGIAIALVVLGTLLSRRSRLLAGVLALIAAVGMLAAAGVPLEWIRHVRITVTGNAIGQGLTALPDVLVPYLGINEWVRLVIVLGAGVLLLDAAVLAALTPRDGGDLRRAAAALPLVALAIVPATIIRPGLAYLQGLVLFALIAAFMWGDRLPASRAAGGVGALAVVSVVAIIAAPRIDPKSAWVNYEKLAGSLSLKDVDHFDWRQRYGPISWPRDDRTVFEVKAAHPDYWKVQNLDFFDGRGWAAEETDTAAGVPPPSAAAVAQWTQTIQVTIEAMKTPFVIAAGSAAAPQHVPEGFTNGISPGTWLAGAVLGPGASYTVKTYSPRPSAEQLGAITDYSSAGQLPGDLTVALPPPAHSPVRQPEVTFFPFHSTHAATTLMGATPNATWVLDHSPYARAFALARGLAAAAPTPYAYVQSVMRYLAHGFTYDEDPHPSRLPLETFLFSSRHGYCQQFAGAMALLLRMGGIPARVAVGFTTGTFDKATGEWQVNDFDAHAWVEAWFPTYGWVRFDPTPSTAPARGGATEPILKKQKAASASKLNGDRHRDIPSTAGGASGGLRHAAGSGNDTAWIALALVLLAAVGILVLVRRGGEATGEQLVAELERAFRRTGRPIGTAATLAALEQRFRDSRDAEAYVRAIRLQRYAGARGDAQRAPTSGQRRAVRRQLAIGTGRLGWLRAWWALPPRRAPRPRSSRGGDVQSR